MGPTRLFRPLDRILAQGCSAWTGDRRGPGGLSRDHGCILLVVPPYGASGRTVNEEGWHYVHHDLLRQPDGREEFFFLGSCFGGVRLCGSFCCFRGWFV